jgi:hypothetical protein
MLVFFIHGVATRNSNYSDQLSKLIRTTINQQNQKLPLFYSSFWGDILRDKNQIWNYIFEDLRIAETRSSKMDRKNFFRYQEFREGFLSDFMGDVMTYLNEERGHKIRHKLTDQLSDLINKFPDEKNLHIVSHSLGTVIFFDMLFSGRFDSGDPAFKFRSLIKGLPHPSNVEPPKKVFLRSITTMGSPVLLFNTMLNVDTQTINDFFSRYQNKPLRWINLIHSSDLIAYPLGSSFSIGLESKHVFFRDKYLSTDANVGETGARIMGQNDLAMAIAAQDAHSSYWSNPISAKLITANLLGFTDIIDKEKP